MIIQKSYVPDRDRLIKGDKAIGMVARYATEIYTSKGGKRNGVRNTSCKMRGLQERGQNQLQE